MWDIVKILLAFLAVAILAPFLLLLIVAIGAKGIGVVVIFLALLISVWNK